MPRPPTLLVATTNAGKLREISDLLGDLPVRLRSLAEMAPLPSVHEDGETYVANAVSKALTIARASRCITLADDSGLEVDALGGAPGVHSARYAGIEQQSDANIDKLLVALRNIPPARRTARFRCVIAVASPAGATLTADGECEGLIIYERRGASGFGYDPIFLHPESGQTFGEISAAFKNRISHRARACTALRGDLLEFLARHAPPR